MLYFRLEVGIDLREGDKKTDLAHGVGTNFVRLVGKANAPAGYKKIVGQLHGIFKKACILEGVGTSHTILLPELFFQEQ